MTELAVRWRHDERGGEAASHGSETDEECWFSGLYEETFESAFRFARMLTRDGDLAEDVVAEVYLRAWQRRGDLRTSEKPLSWILAVTRNRAIDEFRSRRPHVDLGTIPDPQESIEDQPLEMDSAQREVLRQAMARLTAEQQRVVFLRFYEQKSHDEVARALGRSPNAIRAIQFRAVSRLRKLLEANRVR
ncbi:MAG: sigma-70 family RNA polymerase sigma factor [Chloroflexi bacterium]|nr:sigma-70 family RNA polymerase sigma factor [Chloroflexota bacterium]